MTLMMVNNNLLGGFNQPLCKMMEFVSWDDDIPKTNGKVIHSCSSHHQPDNHITS